MYFREKQRGTFALGKEKEDENVRSKFNFLIGVKFGQRSLMFLFCDFFCKAEERRISELFKNYPTVQFLMIHSKYLSANIRVEGLGPRINYEGGGGFVATFRVNKIPIFIF